MQATAVTWQPSQPGFLGVVDQLLRDPRGLIDRIDETAAPQALIQHLTTIIVFGAAAFGGAIGTYRGGVQLLYAAVKLPAAVMMTTVLCAPLLSCLNLALDRPADLRRDLARLLAALGLASLVLAAEAPIVLLAALVDMPYHALIQLLVALCVIAGLVGALLLLRMLVRSSRRGLVALILVLGSLGGAVGAQVSWGLRPFVVRPRTVEVPFVRSVEGDFFSSVATSARSARGIYDEPGAYGEAWP